MGVVLPFNKPISPLVAIATPGLYGERLVLIIFVAGLFVGFFEEGLDGFGGGEGPEDQGFEESELRKSLSASGIQCSVTFNYPLYRRHTGECASTMGRILSIPRSRPLRLVSLNCFFECSLEVTTSDISKRVR